MSRSSISVVIPVYNSAATLEPLVERLQRVLGDRGAAWEILFVNDGSRDDSWNVVCRLAERYPHVTGINLMRNYGQHNAVLCGIRAAKHDVIVTMDDDLQHPPEEIPKLLAKLDDGHDVVYGTPEAMQHGLYRNAASRITKLAMSLAMGAETAEKVSAFRAFRTRLREAFAAYQATLISCDVLLTWGTTRFAAVPVRHDPRRVGTSNYNFRKLLVHAINMATGFSVFPLQIASLIGFSLTLLGAVMTIWVALRYLFVGGTPAGFPFLASIICVFSGGQLLAIGIIGEYLARMYHRTMNRPPYVIAQQVEGTARNDEEVVPLRRCS